MSYSIVKLAEKKDEPEFVYYMITKSKPNICCNLLYQYYKNYKEGKTNIYHEYYKVFENSDEEYYYYYNIVRYDIPTRREAKHKLLKVIQSHPRCINESIELSTIKDTALLESDKLENPENIQKVVKERKSKYIKKERVNKTVDLVQYRKEYYDKNKEKIHEYYLNNKDKYKKNSQYIPKSKLVDELEQLKSILNDIKSKINPVI